MIHFQDVRKTYDTKKGEVTALDIPDLKIERGEFVVVRGHSGSGKTTLLLTAGGMLRPTNGVVSVDGEDLYRLPPPARARFRAETVGFVFQMFHLIPYLNAIENIIMARGRDGAAADRGAARELLERLGLSHRETHLPAELSAGERQRTALARALLNKPKLILADEPTGNLDLENAAEVLRHLEAYHKDGGTVLVVTHGTTADASADRIVCLKNGGIELAE